MTLATIAIVTTAKTALDVLCCRINYEKKLTWRFASRIRERRRVGGYCSIGIFFGLFGG